MVKRGYVFVTEIKDGSHTLAALTPEGRAALRRYEFGGCVMPADPIQFGVQQVARIFNVPSVLLGHDVNAPASTPEQDNIRPFVGEVYWPVEGCDSGQIIAVNALGCDERSVRVADAAAAVAALDRIEAALAFDERRPWLITQQAADARRALRGLREAISGE